MTNADLGTLFHQSGNSARHPATWENMDVEQGLAGRDRFGDRPAIDARIVARAARSGGAERSEELLPRALGHKPWGRRGLA